MSILLINQLENKSVLDKFNEHIDVKFNEDSIYIELLNDFVLNKQSDFFVNSTSTILSCMIGEIYDIEEKKRILKQKGYEFKQNIDVEFITYLYEEYGVDELRNLNGKFVICIYNRLRKETIIINDRYGFQQLFYCINDGKYTFCNDPNILLDYIENVQENDESIKQMLTYGYILGEETLIKNIKKIKPASIIVLKDDGVKQEQYWNWNKIKRNQSISYEEAVEKSGILWLKSVKKMLSKHTKYILPLSGGLDSRAILAAIDYLGLHKKIKKAFTMGDIHCRDVLISEEICNRANIEHEIVEYTSYMSFEDEEERIKNNLGASCYIYSSAYNYFRDNKNYPYIDGFAGDAVFGGSFLNSEVVNGNRNYLKYCNLCLRKNGVSEKEILKFHLNDIKSDKNGFLNYNNYDYYFLNNHVKNYTNSGVMSLGHDCNNVIPFFDNELIDFLYSLPYDWRVNSKLYKDMLIKFFPKFFIDIPWQKTGKPLKKIGITSNCLKKVRLQRYSKNTYYKKSNKKLILFGASKCGVNAYKILKYKYNDIYFCDNDMNKWNKSLMGEKIISPEELFSIYDSNCIIMITSIYSEEIAKQLVENGIKKFFYIKESINKNFRNIEGDILSNQKLIYDSIRKDGYLMKQYIDCEKFLKIFNEYIRYKIHNYRDICLVYSLIKFFRIYFYKN